MTDNLAANDARAYPGYDNGRIWSDNELITSRAAPMWPVDFHRTA